MLTKPEDVPLHAVIRAHLLNEIESGRLRPGDQIPTEPELITRYEVSRTTVRRALRDLETRGLIDRQPGRGSFVREPRLEPRLDRLTGFVEDMEALGLSASAKVITIEHVAAPRLPAERLKIPIGSPTVHIERIRLANSQPVSFDDSYFPDPLGSKVAAENLEVEPFYSILEQKYGMALSQADYVMAAAVTDTRTAKLLDTEPGAPVLLMERTSYVAGDEAPILFENLYFRGDRIRYRLRLDR
jgi:GntR family transcriptional regulator